MTSKQMNLVESLRMEAACAAEVAESGPGGELWRDGLALIGRKMAAAADEIERLRQSNERDRELYFDAARDNQRLRAALEEIEKYGADHPDGPATVAAKALRGADETPPANPWIKREGELRCRHCGADLTKEPSVEASSSAGTDVTKLPYVTAICAPDNHQFRYGFCERCGTAENG